MDKIKKQLEAEKKRILQEIKSINNSVSEASPDDNAEFFDDVDNLNQRIENLDIKDKLKLVLKDVESALSKIDKGSKGKYGICENCKKPIEKKRLETYPFAKYCTACMNKLENEE